MLLVSNIKIGIQHIHIGTSTGIGKDIIQHISIQHNLDTKLYILLKYISNTFLDSTKIKF